MLNRETIKDDISLAEGMSIYMSHILGSLVEKDIEPEDLMGINQYMGLVALMYTIQARANGKNFDEALEEAESRLDMDIAVAESRAIDKTNDIHRM